MPRISVAEAARGLSQLVDRVRFEGITVDLERGQEVVARLTPVDAKVAIKVAALNQFLASLPLLGDDRIAFQSDVQAVRRQFPAEADPWD